jgi:hypothetical protein
VTGAPAGRPRGCPAGAPPDQSQRTKYQYAVCHGGKSAGNCRYEHPALTT